MTLFYFLGIIVIITFSIYYFVQKDGQKDKKSLKNDWQIFLKSVSLNDINGISIYGDSLIWNKHLKTEQLNKIIEVVNSNVNDFPELKPLQNNAMNKKLHFNRHLPY